MSKPLFKHNKRAITHLVSPRESMLLKELDFNKPCCTFLDSKMQYEWRSAFPVNHNLIDNEISQPSYQQVLHWLRDNHSVYASILPSLEMETFDLTVVVPNKKETYNRNLKCNDYDSALKKSVSWILENIQFTN